ncbi:hypothetical protein AMTRI_Chr10g227040 [Amborella trichopoda]
MHLTSWRNEHWTSWRHRTLISLFKLIVDTIPADSVRASEYCGICINALIEKSQFQQIQSQQWVSNYCGIAEMP